MPDGGQTPTTPDGFSNGSGGQPPAPPPGWTQGGNQQDPPPGGQPPDGNWNPHPATSIFHLNQEQTAEFNSARKLTTISQIMAIVSLFIGGILLSAAAIVVAFVARGRMQRVASQCTPEVQAAIMRSTIVPIGFCLLAFALNIASLILLYPMVMEMLQNGSFQDLFPFGGSTSGGSSAGSFWA